MTLDNLVECKMAIAYKLDAEDNFGRYKSASRSSYLTHTAQERGKSRGKEKVYRHTICHQVEGSEFYGYVKRESFCRMLILSEMLLLERQTKGGDRLHYDL